MTADMGAPGLANEKLEELGLNLVRDGEAAGIRIRLLGGVAVRLLCKELIAEHPELDRQCGDIDLAGLSEDAVRIEQVLAGRGFAPHREFNFLNESSRMLFSKVRLKVDVILDEFRMNHRWPIRKRLTSGRNTLPHEDLLLAKLQVVEQAEKDIQDLLAMAATGNALDMEYIVRTATRTWGFSHTVLVNCDRAIAQACHLSGCHANVAVATLDCLKRNLRAAPKSLRWRLRARFGESLRWYEFAEEPSIILQEPTREERA